MVLLVHKNVRHEGEVKHLKKCRSGYSYITVMYKYNKKCVEVTRN